MAFLQTESLWVSELADGVAALVLDVPGTKTNIISGRLLDELGTALDQIEQAGRFRLLVVRSGKETHFAAGPGAEELGVFTSPEAFTFLAQKGQDVLDRLRTLTVPSVAVIGGTCQGGGLELALACDYRVVVEGAAVRLGFLGAELGLMPAWGGTQRLPRLIGLERSLPMLLGDRQLSAAAALACGLVDGAVQKNGENLPAFLSEARKRPLDFLAKQTWRQWALERFRWGRWLIYHGTQQLLNKRLPDDLPGPRETLAAIQAGLEQGMPLGLDHERAGLARLGQCDAYRNLLRIQQAMAQTRRELVEGPRPLRNIGIVGAGTRGLQLLALTVTRGCQTVVRELDETSLGAALYQVLSTLLPAVQTGVISAQDFQRNLSAIHGTTDWKGFDDLDMVLEAVGPDAQARKELFLELEKHTRPDTLLVTTTGDQTLQELREGLEHLERVACLHFPLPVTRGSAVEVVGPPRVQEKLARDLSAWAVHLGAMPVRIQDTPGMLVQRVWLAGILEAMILFQEWIPMERIDEACRRFGLIRGPLEQADMLGLHRVEQLAADLEAIAPGRFPFDNLLTLLADRNWLGCKTRAGFYNYTKNAMKPNKQLLAALRQMQDLDAKVELLSPREQLQRCRHRIIWRTVNEAAWCLEESVAANAETLDLAMALAGWAPHRGGPIAWARRQGIQVAMDALQELAQKWGPRFLPCPAWQTLQATPISGE